MRLNNLYIKAVTIFAVFICIFTVVLTVAVIAINLFFRKEPDETVTRSYTVEATEKEKKISSATKQFTPQGRMLLIEDDQTAEKKYRRIYDTDYNLLWEGNIENIPTEYITLKSDIKPIQSNDYISNSRKSLAPDLKKDIVIDNHLESGETEHWRYSDDGYFEGFLNGQAIGYLGADGFAKTKAMAQRFEDIDGQFAYTEDIEKSPPLLLCRSGKKLYLIDIRRRQVKLLLKNTSQLYMYNWFEKNSKGEYVGAILNKSSSKLVAVFRENLEAVEITGVDGQSQMLEIAYSENASGNHGYEYFIIWRRTMDAPCKNAPEEVVRQWISDYANSKHKMLYKLYGLDSNGHAELISEYDLTIVPQTFVASNQAQIDSFKSRRGYLFDLSPVIFYYLAKTQFVQDASTSSKVIREILGLIKNFKPYHVWTAWALGCLCAVAVFFHNKNRTQSKAALISWMGFALLFNVAGMLTCLALTHYNLVKCENCGRDRHLLTEKCLHCNEEMPVPQRQVTDIICGKTENFR
jgi:hypothetical protein